MKKQFALNETPVHYQLTIHFMNLFAYFHPGNEAGRMDSHKYVSAMSSEILKMVGAIRDNDVTVEEILESMHFHTVLDLRIAQILQYYGKDAVTAWITSIYGVGKVA